MLNPFRIRNLCFNSVDLVDWSGVVQISAQHYDQEIQACPDLILAYLDEDDGETVTVGSSFELEQRLLEPPERYSSWKSHLASDNPPPLHVFDTQPSARAAEAWRKYAIEYRQPDPPSPAREPGPKTEKCKPDDYQSLLARFQVLELEVKLLKEAFKTHAITSPLRPHLPQQSVFASGYKNSDLSKQPPTSALPSTPIVPKPTLRCQGTKRCSGRFGVCGCHKPNLNASKQNNIDVAGVRPVELSDHHLLRTQQKNDFLETLRFEHASTALPGYLALGDMSDLAGEGSLPRISPLLHGDVLQEPRKDAGSSSNSISRKPTNFENPEAPSKDVFMNEAAGGQSVDWKSPVPCQQGKTVDIETVAIPSSTVAVRHSASKSLLDLEPEAEIARFPTIFQLEKEDLRSVTTKSSNAPDSGQSTSSLTRANTVTSSNPAARLQKPFDPANEEFGINTRQLRYLRRQHQAEDMSGSGKTLWEEFKRAEPQADSAAPRLSGKPESQSLSGISPHALPFRSQSLNQHRTPNHPASHRLVPMRSAFDLSEAQRNQHDAVPVNYSRPSLPADIRTPSLVSRPRTDPDHKRTRRVESCVRSLQDMGYKPHSRLPIYAEACDGDISKALTMAEEDEIATRETRKATEMEMKVVTCVTQLKDMGYSAEYHDDHLRKFAKNVGGDVALAVESIEAPSSREMTEWRERLRVGRASAAGMPGSFP